MSKKSNSKKIKESIQKLNYPSAKEIKIKFIEGNIDYLKSNNDNLLFKTYLLSYLIHKTLSIGYTGDLDFLNSNNLSPKLIISPHTKIIYTFSVAFYQLYLEICQLHLTF